MDIVRRLLRESILFRHCSDDEIEQLYRVAYLASVKKGQSFDLKNTNSFSIVVHGLFELEGVGGSNSFHCSTGSFLGAVPLTGSVQRGIVKAMVDSTLLVIGEEEIYRFFLLSFKGLRGYIRAVRRAGFETSPSADAIMSGEKTKVVTVFSPARGSGKSYFSALLGTLLDGHGKTVILDVSFSGESLFSAFGKKITSPLSQKSENQSSFENLFLDRIERIDDNLHLLNVAFGSKVKVDPEIISPILFSLSKTYRYIICDLSDDDTDLRNEVFDCSDIIFTLAKSGKEQEAAYDIFDNIINDGQRVIYVHNEHTMGKVNNLTGSMLLDSVSNSGEGMLYQKFKELADRGQYKNFLDLLIKKQSALVLESNMLEAVFFFGILNSLDDSDKHFDLIYTSSFSYIITALFMASGDKREFRKNVLSFFKQEKINSFLDITFPEKFVFKNNAISRFAADIAGKNRLEMFSTVPMAMLANSENGLRRIFSTGMLKDCLDASFLMYPVFEAKKIGNAEFSSGYPANRVRVEDLYRADVDYIDFISINNKDRLCLDSSRALLFYRKYIEFIEDDRFDQKESEAADSSFTLEINESDFSLEQLLEKSEEAASGIIKNIHNFQSEASGE